MVITLVRNVIRTLLECRQDRSPGRPVPQSRPVCLARNPGPCRRRGIWSAGVCIVATGEASRPAQWCRRRATMIRRPLTMKSRLKLVATPVICPRCNCRRPYPSLRYHRHRHPNLAITGQLNCDVGRCLRVGRHDAGRGPAAGDQSIYRITGMIGTAER